MRDRHWSPFFEKSEYTEEVKQMPAHDRTHQSTRPADALDVMTRLNSMLDHWRAHVDEFLVQLDLAHMEIRDALTNSLESAGELETRLEKRVNDFRHSLAQQREAATGIKQDVSRAAAAARKHAGVGGSERTSSGRAARGGPDHSPSD